MSTVLIVDDEVSFLDELALTLSRDGHIVMTASDAFEAIQTGSRYRPDVLLTDWMLRSNIHGLDVADVLKVVEPGMRVVLMTGFASTDLEAEVEARDVFGFLKKPFARDDIRAMIRRAAKEEPLQSAWQSPPIGVAEINPDGTIVFANNQARSLFADSLPGGGVGNFMEFFQREDDFLKASSTWVRVYPFQDEERFWFVRATEWSDIESRLVLIIDSDDKAFQNSFISMLLLGEYSRNLEDWPVSERILILERDPLFRRRISEGLHKLGCMCLSAENSEEAQRLLQRDPQIRIVVLDAGLTNGGTGALIRRFRSIRPSAYIVGSGVVGGKEVARALGFDAFLAKPWFVEDLASLLVEGQMRAAASKQAREQSKARTAP